ncbi:hypothetical protein Cgig2_033732 [Carnegiea gigantea]|uniref:Uncharacterized protein n=1 Tax=Carnegiea gigantea TaxID=171969 RepID=A0A9Q1K177_9CARY|nr:hypothetical protein Cgig2_033732 [Carnegiea gigantea]
MTDEMALYILGNFKWCRREVVLPSHLLSSDYDELFSNFVCAVAKEYAQDYEVPEFPQVVFLAMLYNDTVKLGVLRGWMIGELQWSALQVWVGCNRGGIMEARQQVGSDDLKEEESSGSDDQTPLSSAGSEEESSTLWPSLIPENHHGPCPDFYLLVAMQYVHNSRIPKMTRAIFYAMVLIDAAELELSSRIVIDYMMSALRELKWDVIESWLL